MEKVYIYHSGSLVRRALTEIMQRLITSCDVRELSKLSNLRIKSDGDKLILVVDVDSVVVSNELHLFSSCVAGNLNFKKIILSAHDRLFLDKILQINPHDLVIDSSSSWDEFAEIISSQFPNNNELMDVSRNLSGIRLTKRQRQILLLSSRGNSNRDIAAALSISEHTVKVHIWRMYKILGVKNRLQATILGKKLGYL